MENVCLIFFAKITDYYRSFYKANVPGEVLLIKIWFIFWEYIFKILCLKSYLEWLYFLNSSLNILNPGPSKLYPMYFGNTYWITLT